MRPFARVDYAVPRNDTVRFAITEPAPATRPNNKATRHDPTKCIIVIALVVGIAISAGAMTKDKMTDAECIVSPVQIAEAKRPSIASSLVRRIASP